MLYYDFDWDVSRDGIVLDKDMNLKKLEWSAGDYFKLVENENGNVMLVKVDIVEQFLIKGLTEPVAHDEERE